MKKPLVFSTFIRAASHTYPFRAAKSQKAMEEMMQRFEEVKNKVERTRQTLTEAAERARKHEELKSTIDELKARTEKAIVYKETALLVLDSHNNFHA